MDLKKIIIALLLAFVVATVPVVPVFFATAVEGGKVVVLTFHEVVESQNEVSNSAIISAAELEETILSLKERGYQFLHPQDFLNYLDGTTRLFGKNILITFDDGYEGVFKNAFPVLSQYGIKAIVFPVWKWYTKNPRPESHRPHLSREETLEMLKAGWYFGGHTFDGHWRPDGETPFLLKQKDESQFIYELRVWWDIFLMKKEMTHLGVEPKLFAFPYGAYNATVAEMLRLAGFKYFFSSEPGFVNRGKYIPRVSGASTAEETIKMLEGLAW